MVYFKRNDARAHIFQDLSSNLCGIYPQVARFCTQHSGYWEHDPTALNWAHFMSLASAGAGASINLIQIGEELFWPSRRGTSRAFQVQHNHKGGRGYMHSLQIKCVWRSKHSKLGIYLPMRFTEYLVEFQTASHQSFLMWAVARRHQSDQWKSGCPASTLFSYSTNPAWLARWFKETKNRSCCS